MTITLVSCQRHPRHFSQGNKLSVVFPIAQIRYRKASVLLRVGMPLLSKQLVITVPSNFETVFVKWIVSQFRHIGTGGAILIQDCIYGIYDCIHCPGGSKSVFPSLPIPLWI